MNSVASGLVRVVAVEPEPGQSGSSFWSCKRTELWPHVAGPWGYVLRNGSVEGVTPSKWYRTAPHHGPLKKDVNVISESEHSRSSGIPQPLTTLSVSSTLIVGEALLQLGMNLLVARELGLLSLHRASVTCPCSPMWLDTMTWLMWNLGHYFSGFP